ncbi:MAG: threonylcarbamoyl-AMP synthase [Chitinophagaceae bacterium]|nr:threonylcarbamoyl-AMP synthase [Chitinophagaceae bacterium]
MAPIGINILRAADLLEAGELVAIPTETVYGLAANALNEQAIVKVFEAKNRPSFNPLIVHVVNLEAIDEYAVMDDVSRKLAEAFMPGPFTLLLPKKAIIPDLVTAGSSKVAIRIPKHPLAIKVLMLLKFPLAAPSANVSGYVSPTTAKHVSDGLTDKISYILDGGPCEVGLESTIVEVVNNEIVLHRAGAVTIEALENVSGLKVVSKAHSENPATAGQMKSHYATKIPLIRGDIEQLLKEHEEKYIATISFSKSYRGLKKGHQYILSPKGDLNEAAQHLFSVMRSIDEFHFDVIITELFPDTGLGKAINDRLGRALSENK